MKKSGLAVTASLGALALALSASAAGRGFMRFTDPTGETRYEAGQTVALHWAGGDPGWTLKVGIYDIDQKTKVASSVQANHANDGATNMPIPRDLDCNSHYQFVIQETNNAAYAFGGVFTVACGGERPPPPPPPSGKPQQTFLMCGEAYNETFQYRDRVELIMPVGGGFQGNLVVHGRFYGNSPFTGAVQPDGTCQITAGHLQFQGQCSAERISGRYTIDGQKGTMELTAGACPDQPPPPPPPQPPPPPPPQPGTVDPLRLCGRIHNETHDVYDQITMTLNPGGGFSGRLDIGLQLYGSGEFTGSRNGDQCQGVGGGGHLRFQGTCTADSFTARYTIDGQQGAFGVSAGACTPGVKPPPQPINRSVHDMPVGPARPLKPAQPPEPPPQPLQPAIANKLCGQIHNTTHHMSDTVTIVLNPGGGFSGKLNVGAMLYGSGDFTGSRNGTQCQGVGGGGHLQFQGTCTADSFDGSYTIDGQQGTMSLTAAACPR